MAYIAAGSDFPHNTESHINGGQAFGSVIHARQAGDILKQVYVQLGCEAESDVVTNLLSNSDDNIKKAVARTFANCPKESLQVIRKLQINLQVTNHNNFYIRHWNQSTQTLELVENGPAQKFYLNSVQIERNLNGIVVFSNQTEQAVDLNSLARIRN